MGKHHLWEGQVDKWLAVTGQQQMWQAKRQLQLNDAVATKISEIQPSSFMCIDRLTLNFINIRVSRLHHPHSWFAKLTRLLISNRRLHRNRNSRSYRPTCLYTVSNRAPPFYIVNNSVKTEPILIIFLLRIPRKFHIYHKMFVNSRTSPE